MLAYHFGYEPYGPVRRGKRLRPQIVMRVATGGGAPLEAALDAACAVEILHNYSLVHDDIEDRDALRHGRPALWSRDGIAQALNAGDAMCAMSILTMTRAKRRHAPERVLAMVEALHHAHRIMCDGQSLDLQFEGLPTVRLAAYRKMIACKTGALFAAACIIGGHCAGAQPADIARLDALGFAFGEAFQIRDDVLGVWSDMQRTGKVAGNDLARRKWTFPIVWALECPPGPDREVVANAYASGKPLDDASVTAVTGALDRLGAQEAARQSIAEPVSVIRNYPDEALAAFLIDSLDL